MKRRLATVLLALVVPAMASSQEATAGASPAAVAAPSAREGAAHEALTRELASAAAHRDALAATAVEHAARREAVAAASAVQVERFAELTSQLESAAPGSAEVDRLYARAVAALVDERPRLAAALDALEEASAVPSWTPAIDLAAYQGRGLDPEVNGLRDVAAELDASAAELRTSESELRWAEVEQAGRAVAELNRVRLAALDSMSEEGRRQLLGVTRDGVAQLRRELDQLVLDARLYQCTQRHQLGGWRRLLGDIFVIGSITLVAVKLLAVLLVAWWLAPRWRRLLAGWRDGLVRGSDSLRWKRRVTTWADTLDEVARWPLVLALLAALSWALGEGADARPLRILLTAVAFYAAYRFAIDLFVHLVVAVAHRYRLGLAEDRRQHLISSVRWMMRVAAAIAVLLLVSEQVLGRGALFNAVTELAWWAVVATAVLILVGWRRVMSDTLLALQPSGRLSAAVRAGRDRWYGVLVAPAAFVWLAGRAAAAVARDFALGFEQTGKVLAYLFRRKVERQAVARGFAEADPDALPPRVLAAFSEEPVGDSDLVVPHFPGLEQLQRDLAAWHAGGVGGAFLVAGERGVGTTSWLNQAAGDLPATRVNLVRRARTPAELADRLAAALELPAAAAGGLDALADALAAGQRRLVVLDHAQHLFLAAVGGYAAFGAFADLVNRSRDRVVWLCGMNAYGWRHLAAVRTDVAVFRARFHLPAWNEQAIRELIRRRCTASGASFDFTDLVVDQLEGISSRSSLVESEEGYTRLLWDYADGNPRAALHYFVRSLEPAAPGHLRVRMFRAPAAELLEEGGETGMFLLASILTHESIDLADLAAVSRTSERDCGIHVARLEDLGAVAVDDGLIRITTHWHRVVVRLLRRRNFIPD